MNEHNVFDGIGGLICYICPCLALILFNWSIEKRFEKQSVQLDALKTQVEAFYNDYVEHDTVFVYQVKRDTIVEYKVIPQ